MNEIKQYVENAITDGKEVTKRYANRCNYSCDYIFIKENNNYISIISITDGIDNTVIQANCYSSKGYKTRFGMYRSQRTVNRFGNDFVKHKGG